MYSDLYDLYDLHDMYDLYYLHDMYGLYDLHDMYDLYDLHDMYDLDRDLSMCETVAKCSSICETVAYFPLTVSCDKELLALVGQAVLCLRRVARFPEKNTRKNPNKHHASPAKKSERDSEVHVLQARDIRPCKHNSNPTRRTTVIMRFMSQKCIQ